jgi:stearoyl-CoA desaturase (delta-9 desaturase)
VLRDERRRAGEAGSAMLSRMRTLLIREASLVEYSDQEKLAKVLEDYRMLNVVYQFRMKLQSIWARSSASHKELVDALQDWCKQAEASGITVLKDFVGHLKTYSPQQQMA